MTKPQLLAADGTVIFEFDDDKAMRAVLRNTIWQARHGREMRLHFLLNDTLADLLAAIEAHGRAAGDRGFQPMPKSVEKQIVRKPPHDIDAAISQELFRAAPDLGWLRMSHAQKEALVNKAFFPYRLDEEGLLDTIEAIDHWIARYRDG
mgnify:CR=1 FL=1